MPDQDDPSPEQVERRAGSLAAEPGNHAEDPGAQARALLEESEERVEDSGGPRPGRPGRHPAPSGRGRQRRLT